MLGHVIAALLTFQPQPAIIEAESESFRRTAFERHAAEALLPFPTLILAKPAAAGGGSSYGTHRYWRVYITQNAGHSTTTEVQEIEFRGSVGGSDLTGSGTPISGGSGSTEAGTTVLAAFDNTTNIWGRTSPTNTWIGYDFGAPVSVAELAITSATSSFTTAPQSFSLDWSDDNASWTTADTFTAYGWLFGQTRTYPEAAPATGFHRFWRLFVTSTVGGTQTQIVEMEFRATPGGADQTASVGSNNGTASGRVVFSAEAIGNYAYLAYDGVLTTSGGWFVSSGANQYNGFVFPSPVAVQEVTILGSSNTNRSPSALKIEYSDDADKIGGGTWTAAKTVTGLTWTAGETKTFSVP